MKRDVFRRSGLVSAIAVFILLGAVLPNVAYLGHGQTTPSHNHATDRPYTPRSSSGEEHALHCHAGPAGCAGVDAQVEHALRFVFRTADGEGDPFVEGMLDLGVDALWVPIRGFLVLSVFGIALILIATLLLWWTSRLSPPGQSALDARS